MHQPILYVHLLTIISQKLNSKKLSLEIWQFASKIEKSSGSYRLMADVVIFNFYTKTCIK